MRKRFEIGGFIAAAVLIAFGIGAIGMGLNARSTVNNTLSQEQIVGTPGHDADGDHGRGQAGRAERGRPQLPDHVRRRTGDQQRLARPRIRRIHADPRA